jgi:hypothetical protein
MAPEPGVGVEDCRGMEERMLARRLQMAGVVLLVLGLAAHTFGWDALMWMPQAVADAVRAFVAAITWDPLTYGLIAAGLGLIVVARVLRR